MTEARAMATTSDAATMATGAGRPWRGDDFPDWLPPMLVRELRQGIQSGAFFWTFLLIQLALVLHAAFTVLATSGRFDGDLLRASGGFFWTLLVITVGFVIPLRGVNSIATERTGNNLDLVRLTRLSATRIVVGKWAALVAQAALVVASVLPYLVLRYFLGGVNVVHDLRALGWLLVGSAVVAALAIQASTRPQRERVGLMTLVGFGGWGLLMRSMAGGPPFFSGSPGWFGLAVAALYAVLFLEAAAASIAPAAENHALRKRLLGLGCAAVVAGAGMFGYAWDFAAVAFLFGLPVLFAAVGALCERPVRFRRMHAAFARYGVAGRAAAAVLTPGWATGLVFIALAGGFVAAGCLAVAAPSGTPPRMFFAAPDRTLMAARISLTAAAIVFPLPLLLFLPRLKERATAYVAVQAICLVVLGIDAAMITTPYGRGSWSALLAPFPLAGLLRLFSDAGSATVSMLGLAGLVVLAIVLAIVARPWLREMRHTQRLVADRRAAS
jgi:hypothetical protein